MIGLVTGATIFGIIGALMLVSPSAIPDWVFPLSAGLGVFLCIPRLTQPQDDLRQTESRERVLTAEHDLEAALRQIQATFALDGDVAVTINERPIPSPRGEELPEGTQPRLALSELWAVTHRRLDHYHGIALGQARQSFRNAQISMALGFMLLVAFTAIALNASTTAGSVVAGGLGIASAALAGYVSRTFIRSQETAAGHLRAYFDQPLEFSRYLAAERLMADADLSEERRAEVVSLLVQAMITGPYPQGPAGTGEQQASTSI
ncbi:hypothetical protein AB0896_22610 [Streptomyces parvulus]|uniref:hypothetical protein n=1 Tax=Streptomyces parvulus TaxID=146923 RepID=UPI00345156FB